jgi:hypothetical protein
MKSSVQEVVSTQAPVNPVARDPSSQRRFVVYYPLPYDDIEYFTVWNAANPNDAGRIFHSKLNDDELRDVTVLRIEAL